MTSVTDIALDVFPDAVVVTYGRFHGFVAQSAVRLVQPTHLRIVRRNNRAPLYDHADHMDARCEILSSVT
jgi:hypothetical protein